jgi:transcriptional regulator with XRE-family HTH domain
VETREVRALVARNIRAIAREKGLTLNRVADFAAVSKAGLYNVLRGTTAATTDWLTRVATALDVEPWQLLAPRVKKGSRSARSAAASPTGPTRP